MWFVFWYKKRTDPSPIFIGFFLICIYIEQSLRVWNLPHGYNLKKVMEFLGILDLPVSWRGKRSFAFPMGKEKAEAFVKRFNSQVYEDTFIGLRFS